ncbi:hypothetical protein [Actinoplanes sp. NBRC 101535]|uniref:hypothetical protein n=1 Tax=Actinoplanes sp. NBRC 101535 TaxID=3032196 RepID=UPI0024A30B90|nr:hypothetical protein [Actinoplanes sp. NBRC 101535]GLY07396.1 hypothetical protein Acsp01_77750 [Actinoplanes sp. NBRC 101535]
MPIARRSVPALGAATVTALLAVPAAPAAAAGCTVGPFTARAQADLVKIAVLDPGPLTRGLPALADVRLAVAQGSVDSAGRPYRSVAAGRYAETRLLGLPLTDRAAVARAPGHGSPAEAELASLDAGGLTTVKVGKATASAAWEDGYRCGKVGALTRSATMLTGLSVLGGSPQAPAVQAVDGLLGVKKTSLLKVGPVGSTQSATDLVRLPAGKVGVRASAGVSLAGLTLFGGSEQEIAVKVISQPTLQVTAGASPAVDYRPATLEVSHHGKVVRVLKDTGADVSLDLVGSVGAGKRTALAVRLTLGEVQKKNAGREVGAEAATVRVEVKAGSAHLLDVAVGQMAVSATAPGGGGGGHHTDTDSDSGSEPGTDIGSGGGSDGYGSSSRDDAGGSSDDGSAANGAGSGHDDGGSAVNGSGSGSGNSDGSGSGDGSDGSDGDSSGGSGSGSGDGGSGGSTGGSDGDSGSGQGGNDDSSARGDVADTVPVAETVAGDGGTAGSSLPLTGANVAALGLGGAGLIAAGVVALILGRRRSRAGN